MNNWKKLLTGTTVAALLITGTSDALAESGNQPTTVEHQHDHKHHQKLTDEQKQALLNAGVDFTKLKENQEKIHAELRNIRAHSKALHEKAEASGDKNLQRQVKQDLEGFRTAMKQFKEAKRQHKQLKSDLRAAAEAKDTAKIKAAYTKLQTNQQDILKLLQAADKQLQTELSKLK
jgi:NADH dehydrogenase/NADH:ubiquinone oxidoreductase subunit G